MVKPIKPAEIGIAKKSRLPDEVIAASNRLIADGWSFDRQRSVVKQNDAVSLIASSLDVDRKFVFDMNYLDIEDVYSDVGWTVCYDKPGYNEDYEAYFVFKKNVFQK